MHTVMGDATFPDAAQFSPLRYKDPEWKTPEVLDFLGQKPAGQPVHRPLFLRSLGNRYDETRHQAHRY